MVHLSRRGYCEITILYKNQITSVGVKHFVMRRDLPSGFVGCLFASLDIRMLSRRDLCSNESEGPTSTTHVRFPNAWEMRLRCLHVLSSVGNTATFQTRSRTTDSTNFFEDELRRNILCRLTDAPFHPGYGRWVALVCPKRGGSFQAPATQLAITRLIGAVILLFGLAYSLFGALLFVLFSCPTQTIALASSKDDPSRVHVNEMKTIHAKRPAWLSIVHHLTL